MDKLNYGDKLAVVISGTNRTNPSVKLLYYLKDRDKLTFWYCHDMKLPQDCYIGEKHNICKVFDKE